MGKEERLARVLNQNTKLKIIVSMMDSGHIKVYVHINGGLQCILDLIKTIRLWVLGSRYKLYY